MQKEINLKSYDSTDIVADYNEASGTRGALFVHGITSERTETGLYTRLSDLFVTGNISTLSIDLRSHGESAGDQKDFILSGAINDICAGIDYLLSAGKKSILIVAASFSGGLSIRAAELRIKNVSHLVLLNPRLTYTPWIQDPELWSNGRLTNNALQSLENKAYVERKGFKLGRSMINELLSFNPAIGLTALKKPILFVHGKEDSVIPIENTREAHKLCNNSEFIEIPNAQHGFTDPETDDPRSKKSQEIRSDVINRVMRWIDKRSLEI